MQTEPLSSRDKFLNEQKNINASKDLKAKGELEEGVPHVSESEIDEVEKNMEKQKVDKTMGTQKHTLTKEQHVANVQDKQNLKLVMGGKHLSPAQSKILESVFKKAGELDDPVLHHLLKQKAKAQHNFDNLKAEINALNKKIMEELNNASNTLVKTQGVIESLDNQLLDYVEENKILV